MKFPATDIEHSMQDEIDRLKARIEELEAELENYARLALARIRELEGERDRLREALEKIADHPMKFTMPRDDSYWSRLAMQLATMARAVLDEESHDG
jgi:chromosome segregation ATPase